MIRIKESVKINFKTLCTVIMFSCVFNTAFCQQKSSSANIILKTAELKAAKQKKKVLLVCSASFNPWAAILDSIRNKDGVEKILDKYYVTVTMRAKETTLAGKDMERVGASEIFDKFYTVDSAMKLWANNIPTVFILDANGHKMQQYTGFPELMPQFEQMLKCTSAITDDEITTIDQRFKERYTKTGPPMADEILAGAVKQAAAEHKKVFLIFHASWCHWCHVLDTAMSNPACKKFFDDNYVVCHLVVHEDERYSLKQNLGSEAMLEKYQGQRNGIPFWVIFNSIGEHLADFNGFPAPPEADYKDFESILKNTSTITDDQLVIIKKVFTDISAKNGVASSNYHIPNPL